jgi:acyl carrier protein
LSAIDPDEAFNQSKRAETVKEVLLREVPPGLSPADLVANRRLDDDGIALTSLTLIGVLVSLEGTFGIRFSDAVVSQARIDTVQDLIDLVELEYHRSNTTRKGPS